MNPNKPVECPYCQTSAEVNIESFVHVCTGCERTIRALPSLVIEPKAKSQRKKLK